MISSPLARSQSMRITGDLTPKEKQDEFYKRQRERKLQKILTAPTFEAVPVEVIRRKTEVKKKPTKLEHKENFMTKLQNNAS